MTNTQSNRYSMYMAVGEVLHGNEPLTTGVPALSTAVAKFERVLGQIREKDTERIGKTPGRVIAKDEAEDALVLATVIVSSAVAAFAVATGNTQLREAVHVVESRFRNMRMNEQINIAKLTYDLAKANEAKLVPYGIDEAKLEDLKSRTTAYESAMKEVSSGLAERVGAKTAVSELFIQAYNVLKDELDPLMQGFRIADPEFYNEYRAARVVKDIGVRHTKNSAAKAPLTQPAN